GVFSQRDGVYNLTGDGVMTLREIATAMGRRFVGLPVEVLRKGLGVLHRHDLAPYGPEQVIFLQYRPVMATERLKNEFGYVPRRDSRQVFEVYRQSRVNGGPRAGNRHSDDSVVQMIGDVTE
ncbi:MAG: hypothetical protein JRJ84_23435, partial [Deltaproteobacteria bacterium]|nr:hypothetical protein [Deltaproteobacteria bacterium]